MKYKLVCEGFLLDDELRDNLMLSARKLVLDMRAKWPVTMTVKQTEGTVQCRIEVLFPGRKLSVIVRRNTPIAALNAAIDAISATLNEECLFSQTGVA